MLASMASWAAAQDEGRAPASTSAKDIKEITATVVTVDPALKTITVKKDPAFGQTGSQPETTLPVEDKAIANLKMVKAGEKVRLVLRMDPATGKETVSAVDKSKGSGPQ
jgi:Cu/Ag efflux protein CusF